MHCKSHSKTIKDLRDELMNSKENHYKELAGIRSEYEKKISEMNESHMNVIEIIQEIKKLENSLARTQYELNSYENRLDVLKEESIIRESERQIEERRPLKEIENMRKNYEEEVYFLKQIKLYRQQSENLNKKIESLQNLVNEYQEEFDEKEEEISMLKSQVNQDQFFIVKRNENKLADCVRQENSVLRNQIKDCRLILDKKE